MTTNSTNEKKDAWFRRIFRCFPAAIVLLLGFMTLYLIQSTELSITGKPTRDFMWIIGTTELIVYVWIRAFAHVELRTQILALTVLYGLQLCFYSVVRFDGFMGDGRPILVWRWMPTSSSRRVRYVVETREKRQLSELACRSAVSFHCFYCRNRIVGDYWR